MAKGKKPTSDYEAWLYTQPVAEQVALRRAEAAYLLASAARHHAIIRDFQESMSGSAPQTFRDCIFDNEEDL